MIHLFINHTCLLSRSTEGEGDFFYNEEEVQSGARHVMAERLSSMDMHELQETLIEDAQDFPEDSRYDDAPDDMNE